MEIRGCPIDIGTATPRDQEANEFRERLEALEAGRSGMFPSEYGAAVSGLHRELDVRLGTPTERAQAERSNQEFDKKLAEYDARVKADAGSRTLFHGNRWGDAPKQQFQGELIDKVNAMKADAIAQRVVPISQAALDHGFTATRPSGGETGPVEYRAAGTPTSERAQFVDTGTKILVRGVNHYPEAVAIAKERFGPVVATSSMDRDFLRATFEGGVELKAFIPDQKEIYYDVKAQLEFERHERVMARFAREPEQASQKAHNEPVRLLEREGRGDERKRENVPTPVEIIAREPVPQPAVDGASVTRDADGGYTVKTPPERPTPPEIDFEHDFDR